MKSTEENNTVIRRYFNEIWNQKKVESLAELVAENARGYDATNAEPIIGFENIR